MKKAFTQRSFHEETIGDQKVKFHEIPTGTILDSHALVVEVMQAYMTMTRDIKQDAGSSNSLESLSNGSYSTEKILMTAPIDLVQHHDQARAMAVHQFVTAIDKYKTELVGMVIESARITDMTAEEFIRDVGFGTFMKSVVAMIKASSEVFAPFVAAALTPEQVTDDLTSPAEEQSQGTVPGPSLSTPSQPTPSIPTSTTPGNTSPTALPTSPPPAIPPLT